MSESTEFGIIVNDEFHFSLWLMRHTLPLGWRFTGLRGTQADMEELFLQQFVETTPGTHITPDSHFSASQWTDTESEAMVLPSDDFTDSDLLVQ